MDALHPAIHAEADRLLQLSMDPPVVPEAAEEEEEQVEVKVDDLPEDVQQKTLRGLALGQVSRIAAEALPPNMRLSSEARVALQKAATISFLYLASMADDQRRQAGGHRTTLAVQDIREALEAAGMGHLVGNMLTQVKRQRM